MSNDIEPTEIEKRMYEETLARIADLTLWIEKSMAKDPSLGAFSAALVSIQIQTVMLMRMGEKDFLAARRIAHKSLTSMEMQTDIQAAVMRLREFETA